jgi:hypothetical protein
MNELQAAIANQDAKRKKEEEVATLAEAISAQERIIAEASVPSPESMDQARENVAAGAVLGSHTAADLRAIDARIAEEKKVHAEASAKAEKVTAPAKAAVAGLRRRLEKEEKALESLRKEHGHLYQALLRHEATLADEERVRAADAHDAMMRRLIGLQQLLDDPRIDGEKNVLGIFPLEYAIPRLEIPGAANRPGVGPHGRFVAHNSQFSTIAPREGWPETLAGIEKYRLFLLGVTLE